MKKFTKLICLLVIIALLIPMSVSATEDRASLYFAADSCYLYKTSSTSFQVWFDVTGVDGMDELGTSVIKVQRSSDGSTWTDMKTYTKESYPSMTDTNTGHHGGYVTYSGSAGYYYRAYVKFYAKKGTGSAALDRYTSKLKL